MAKTDDIQRMLQIILNKQNALKIEMLGEFDKFDHEISGKFDRLNYKIERFERNLTTRLDAISSRLEYIINKRKNRSAQNSPA